MLTLIFIWLAVCISLMLLCRRASAGLPLAYFVGLSLLHVPGAFLHMDSEDWDWTLIGFNQTVIGSIAFLLGVVIVKYASRFREDYGEGGGQSDSALRQQLPTLNRLAVIYIGIGGCAYFLVMPVIRGVGTLTAIVSSLGALVMIGTSLRLWIARENGDIRKFFLTIAFLPLLPLFTVVQGGFLGAGTYWVVAIASFLFVQSKRPLVYFLITPVIVFVGMSVFVNYMASRDDLRKLVWYERAGLAERMARVEEIFENFEWLDFSNPEHREAIDNRLNQNWLIGAAVTRLESGRGEYAEGRTLGDMIVGLIPRAFWPDKPAVGGGGNLVEEFTGIRFAEGTSVGTGQVLEFYVNFGTLGVIGGFILLGCILGRLDTVTMKALREADQRRFLLGFLTGAALLQPGGNLLEITVSAVSSAITAYSLSYVLNRRLGRSEAFRLPA